MPCSTISLYLGIYILNIRPKICPSAIVPTEAKGLAYSRYYLLGGWMSGTGEAVIQKSMEITKNVLVLYNFLNKAEENQGHNHELFNKNVYIVSHVL